MEIGTTTVDLIRFPSEKQRRVVYEAFEEFTSDGRTLGFALQGSLAHDYADERSDLDFVVYCRPADVEALKAKFEDFHERHRGPDGIWIDYDVCDGDFTPAPMGWIEPDNFEKEVGNVVAYAVPVFERQGFVAEVRAKWLPYFAEELAQRRERRWAEITLNHVEQAHRACDRGEGLEAMERMVFGVQSFVAGLFCARRVYPVDYLKRVDHHLRTLLGIQDLGAELSALFDVGPADPERIRQAFDSLRELALRWLPCATVLYRSS